jgi:hypothetical protein
VLSGVFTAAAIGLGTLLVQSLGGSPSDEPTQGHAASARTFSTATLEEQVADLLAKDSSPEPRVGSSPPSFDAETTPEDPKSNAPMMKPTDQVPDCVRAGIGRSDAALGVEKGTYEGTSSYLVVLPHQSDPAKISAYVVDAACTEQSPGSEGKVLLTRSYAHP